MDNRFKNILERRGIDPLFCLPVFEKCKDFTKLFGDEYHIANTLSECGLMATMRTPIFNNNNSFIGVEIKFKSIYEN